MVSNNEDEKFEGTMVDLGEDLLERTRTSIAPKTPQPDVLIDDEADDLQKGEILMNERLFDDAKKVFRKILRKNPLHDAAKKHLEEIQRQEIQDLLGAESPRRRLGGGEQTESEIAASGLASLEKELHISFEKFELKPVPDLFRDNSASERYKDKVLALVAASDPRDRLDFGVAHLEMGLYDVAQAIFETVLRHEKYRVVGMYLLGLALIYGGNSIEATIRLEPMARDLTLSEPQKTDFLYLMGLAFERLADSRKAREFFRRVYLLNPKYRDVVEKLK